NFLRSGGKKLRSWLQALLRMLYINVFTHLSTFECATSCAVDQKVRNGNLRHDHGHATVLLQQQIYFQKGVEFAPRLPDLRVKRQRNTNGLKGLGTPPCEQAE
ncbi:hypothetical protein P5705_13315, partial [Pseudomonas entomophila]|uniref:hypothetical protein n=1 Tax=Pseudomonas entomophila TaxID=312306 RepID=UPI00240501C5